MKTVYANTNHPALVKWSSIVALVASLGLFVLYMTLDGEYMYLVNAAGFCLLYGTFFACQYYLRHYEVDEEKDTLTDYQNKNYPLYISKLTTATYKENRKGKYRSLFLHDAGVGFMDIRLSKEKADQLLAQLLKVNPNIEVKHVNYL